MPKVSLPSGRTVTVNFDRFVQQLKDKRVMLTDGRLVDDPPDDMTLREIVEIFGWLGLDLDSTLDDLQVMGERLRKHLQPDEDRFAPDDDDDFGTPA